ncbi:MAG: hypothetical protein FWH47_04670, partial [Methanomassiliicoccaceae archaeon]|nr:hypothetical protein [Methanomassiliicoccaceae archaeon]
MIDKEKLSLGEYDPQARAHLDGIIRGAVSGARTMDDVLDAGLRELFEAMLPKDVAADMCAAVSRLGEYTHEEGIYRRSYRSRDPADYFDRLDEMAAEIYSDWGGFDILARIRGEEARQSADDRGPPSSSTVSMLAALRIDRGDEAVIGTVRDTILSDNNARSVGHELIRGVAMSHNAELHGLMRDLLLAARLQEGLRQAILETADDGTLDYFKMMIGAVLENNLLRYSSALRAVGVYMGLGYDYSDRRAVERLLRLAYSYMEDDAGREAAIGSKDSVQMYAGMWAESVFSIQGLNARIEKCFQGDKHQRMVAACFLSEAGSKENGVRLAGGALDETDMDALALIFESYKLGLSDVSDNYWGPDDEMEVAQDRYPRALRDGAARDRHFNRLAEVIGTIPKSGHTVDGKPFDWCLSTMTRGDVYGTMMVLAAYDFDEGKQRRLMELFHLAESQNKVDFLSFFISREINGGGFEGVSRDFLFGCLSEKSMPARIRAAELVKRLTLDEGETAIVEGLLSLKTGEMRQTALEVIMGAGPAAALSSARRLIADRDENKRLAALDILSWAKRSGEVSPEALSELLSSMPAVTGAEAILVAGLEDDTPADHSPENGFGLYDPSYLPEFPPIERDGRYDLKAFRGIGAKDMTRVFDSLRALVEEHEGHAYRAVFGFGVIDHMEDEALLLSAGSPMADTEDSILGDQEFLQIVTPFAADAGPRIEDYALGDVWRGWFEENRGDLLAIVKVFYACEVSDWEDEYRPEYKPFVNDLIKKHLGYGEIKEFLAKERSKKHYYLAKDIIRILVSRAAEGTDVFPIFHGILADFFLSVPKEDWARPCEAVDELGLGLSTRLADTDELRTLIYGMKASAPLAVERLALCYAIGGASGDRYVGLSVEDVARAFADGAVGRGELRRAVMEIGGGEAIGSYTGPLYYHRTAE